MQTYKSFHPDVNPKTVLNALLPGYGYGLSEGIDSFYEKRKINYGSDRQQYGPGDIITTEITDRGGFLSPTESY